MKKTMLRKMFPLLGCIAFISAQAFGQGEVRVEAKASASVVIEPVKVKGIKGEIDWTKGELRVVGQGVPKPGVTHPGQKELTAREAAIATGYVRLAAAIAGVHVSANVLVQDCALKDAEFKYDLDAFVKGAYPLEETANWDDKKEIYSVVMALPLFGSDESLAKIIAQHSDLVEKMEKEKPEPKPVIPPKPVPPPEPIPAPTEGPYTGLIIDCRGLGVETSMCPKIVRPDGSEVWGTIAGISSDVVIQQGIVGYVPTLEAAKASPRAGDNPLIIRAIGAHGGGRKANAVVSEKDAELILLAAKRSNPNFLESYRVTFIVDSKQKKSIVQP